MRVLILSAGDDTGGVAIGLAQALNRHTDWEAREVHRTQNYINYPTDVLWAPNTPKPAGLDELFVKADVIHVMEHWNAVQPFDGWQEKPLVMHHHGSIFRQNHGPLVRTVKQFGAIPIVSTLDLLLLDPDAEWLPNPCDIDRIAALRLPFSGTRHRIGHSPTNRFLKGTAAFLGAVDGLEVDVELIERTSWADTLVRKALCSLWFDQLGPGYGLAGIEAMAMGLPVISGTDGAILAHLAVPGSTRLAELMVNRFGYLPFLFADVATLRDRIAELMTDDALGYVMSDVGRYHVHRYHDEAKVAKQLAGIYERALAA